MRNLTIFRLRGVKWNFPSLCWKVSRIVMLGLFLLTGWLLSGCSRPPEVQDVPAIDTQQPIVREDSQTSTQNLERVDRQGSVEVVVIPVGFDENSSELLSFEISMNTHSVDLSMDLAKLSTLATDHGVIMQASSWSGGSGHHVSGMLNFPARAADGSLIVTGAQKLTLTIREVDAPERVFVWDIPQN
ncbi:MAG: hypothetical protein A2Z14_14975 [Chloroflexi bacterium RBG_16_48_8]|nr:MAG: hypothetical protein A2Z14_14975 [Chloroflexi bacterium RBG_16_48_8]